MPFHLPVATVPFPDARQHLNLMRRVAPPSSVVHVGAGSAVAASRLWEEAAVENLLLVEADTAKARRLLGWQPTTGIEEGLRSQVAWQRAARASGDAT